MIRSPFATALLPLLALIASLVRWLLQGSSNLYTAMHKRFYVPDPDFGWREAPQHPLWIGMEVIAVIGGVLIAIGIAALWIRRRERRQQRRATLLRVLSWMVSPLPMVVPVVAFLSGARPAGARDTLPVGATAAAPTRGIEGSLPLPAGRYEVLDHRGTVVTARVKAGGDEFDASFAGDPKGSWQATPADFTAPMTAEVSVAAASVDTGITLRSAHARDEYLMVAKYPRIAFQWKRLVAARQDGPSLIAFRGIGEFDLVGKKTEVEITGTIKAADEPLKARLGLDAHAAVALLQATAVLPLEQTGLTVSDYDTDAFPIRVSLVLAHRD